MKVALAVPFIIKWPGKIKGGQITYGMVSSINFYPTFIELAGIKNLYGIDGLSFLNLIQGKSNDLAREEL